MTTTWQGWFGLGGQITGAPAVVNPTPDTIDVYARGTDGRLVQKWWDGAKWGPSDTDWLPHEDGGFRLGSSPVVVAQGLNFRDVYARGVDGRVYHKFWDGKKWHGWFGLGGEIKGSPAVVRPTPSTIDVYVQGMDDRLWQKSWDGTKWLPSDDGWWQHDDGAFRLGSAPAVVSRGADHRAVYVRGQNGSLFSKVWNGKQWSAWTNLGGLIRGTPAVVQASPTFHDVYVRGTNDRLWQKWWDGTRWNPSELDWVMHHDGNVRIDGSPSVASSNGDRDVYVRATNGTVLHKFWNNQKHSNAQAIRENANNSAWIDAAAKIETGPGKPGLAVAVIKDGRIVHLAGYGTANLATGAAVTSETMFHTGSCGKLLTSLGIMMLKEAGKLNYDDHIGKHLPELKGYPAGVTLRRMMQHTSGILDLYALNASSVPTNATAIQTAVANKFPMDPEVIGPGAKFKYINSDYDLLGSVIERVTGWSYPVFYNFRVIERLGMTDSFSLPDTSRLNDSNRATGYDPGSAGSFVATPSFQFFDRIVGAGSFYMSVFDLCALEEALASNFLVSSLQDAYTKAKTTFGTELDYGFGWFLRSGSGKIYAEHDGLWNGYRAWFRRCLDRRLSIYTVSNNSAANLSMVADVAMDAYA